MPSDVSVLLLFLVVGSFLICGLGWVTAGWFYQIHRWLKYCHPFLFRLVGFNEKFLEDRNRWVRHLRIYIGLIAAFALLFLLLMLWELKWLWPEVHRYGVAPGTGRHAGGPHSLRGVAR